MRFISAVMIVCGACVAAPSCTTPQMSTSTPPVGPPPVAEKRPKTITVHGDSRVDDYFWLREKANPTVTAYLQAEDAYADAVMKPTAAFQDELYKEMVGHIKEDRRHRAVPARRLFLLHAHDSKGSSIRSICRKTSEPDRARGDGAPGPERAGEGPDVHGARRVRAQRRWSAARVFNRHHRLSAIHAAGQEPGDRRAAAGRSERVGNVAWATDNKTIFYRHGRCGDEAQRQVLPPRARLRKERSGL